MSKYKEKLESFLNVIGTNTSLLAMRDALMSMIPFLSIAGIATFIAYVLLSTDSVIGIGAMFNLPAD